MLYDFDIYSHPEALSEVKNELAYLNGQIKIIEGLEHASIRMAKKKSLDSNTLSKCDVFMGRMNHDTPDDDFDLEVRKLSLDELAFCSISFEERRLRSVTPWFKASNIRTYMEKTKVTCLNRPEIFSRINRLSAISMVMGKRFHSIYMAAYDLHKISKHPNPTELDDQMEDTLSTSEPATTAKQPGAFEFPGMSWTNIEKVLKGSNWFISSLSYAENNPISRVR
ncbi:hypothetical protein VN97_g12628 [Penicillium thymicola]|uniref:Uncharacterized protein n=1 Tax=Penicillium thymicola TaxID=293382 RepID=A0AAI9T5I7_PENTH|nr:hypothetical protein VN97_g12628 [Penicillium thymicola]